MTAKPTKFAFDEEFTNDRRNGSPFGRRAADLERLRQAEEEGYARGMLDGRRDTEQEAAMRMAAAIENLAGLAGGIFARLDEERALFEQQAASLAIAFARKLAGTVLDREPLGALEDCVAESFRQLVGTPHLVARVPLDLVDRAKAMLDRQAAERGFDGRIVVLAEDGMANGDFALEWADGGISHSRAALDEQIAAAIERHIGPLNGSGKESG